MGFSDFFKEFDNLKVGERQFVTDHPLAASSFRGISSRAKAEARRRYPDSVTDGIGDAFRHCYWNALMTREQGEALAEKFANEHENFDLGPKDSIRSTIMDLHNNKVGRSIGKRFPEATDAEMANHVVAALDRDELIIIENGNLVRSRTRTLYTPPPRRF